MRLFVLSGLLAICLNFPSGTSSQGARQEEASQSLDVGKSGTVFMKVCSNAGEDVGNNPQRAYSDAMCQGWVEGFADGFTVHDELLGVSRADRLVCIPRNVTNVQVIGAIKKYISVNPDKAHRATRLVASVALAQAFPCRRAK